VHPNVPAPNQSQLALFWRRLKMMLIAVIAPEIMVGFAARQFFCCALLIEGCVGRLLFSTFRHLMFVSRTEFGFSRAHGFFFCMGGFVSSTGYPVVAKKQLADPVLGPEFLAGIKDVDAEDIMDKSKGDALSKGLALAQGLWFATQFLARAHQHLAVTELEVATLAFAVVNLFIWLLWWNKPLDVQRQVVVGPTKPPNAQPIRPAHVLWSHRFSSAIFGIAEAYAYDPLSSTSVPSFWSLPQHELDHLQGRFLPFMIEALVGTMFGAIHCAAWNADFPTTAEMWMWRLCSSHIVAIPVIILLLWILVARTEIDESQLREAMLGIGYVVPIPIYIIARLVLIILPLVTLRSLPSSTFVDVNWSVYISHL
jgi:hypothetical protein